MDTTAQWTQDLVKPVEEKPHQQMMERRVRPQKEQALHCPRCNSTNTKFCYYNNYSLTQPRYVCKTCRRYWTEGGSLRNVPVGGGSRKNRRSISSSSSTTTSLPTVPSSSSSKIKLSIDQNPKFHEGHDLNLAFHLPEFSAQDHFPNMESNRTSVELLRSMGGISNTEPNIPSMPMSTEYYPSGFGVQDYMRSNTLSFPLDSISEQSLLFPFKDSSRQHEHVPSTDDDDERFEQQNRGQGGGNNIPPVFWNGMIGGGGSW